MDRDIVRAVRANHLRANIAQYEDGAPGCVYRLHWRIAFVDGLGHAPYVHLPVSITEPNGPKNDRIVIRVYPPKRLADRLIKLYGYRWGRTWRSDAGAPNGWPHSPPVNSSLSLGTTKNEQEK